MWMNIGGGVRKLVALFVFLFCTFSVVLGREKFKTPSTQTQSKNVKNIVGDLALEPDHYFYVPTNYVLNRREFILSIQEFAIGIDRNLHVFLSPPSSICGIFLGGKYRLSNQTAIGVGLASGWHLNGNVYWLNSIPNNYAYDYDLGLGAFLSKSITSSSNIVGAIKIWDGYINGTLEYGAYKKIGDYTKLIYEVMGGTGVATNGYVDANFLGSLGLRYVFPEVKPLSAGLGAVLDNNFRRSNSPSLGKFKLYIDISYASSF